MADWLECRFGAQVTWLPFDLHPEYPEDGLPRKRLLERYGDAGIDRVRRMFEATGLVYNPHPEVVPNTMRALRVTEVGRERGRHKSVHDRLMDAYWAEGRNIGDPAELRTLANEAGLDGDEVDDVLAGDGYVDRVLASTAEAQSIGVTGIPAFVLDGRLLILGAQPREVFEQAFSQLAE
jgi:predicted DsbA family dithiol-disulfide isomerase